MSNSVAFIITLTVAVFLVIRHELVVLLVPSNIAFALGPLKAHSVESTNFALRHGGCTVYIIELLFLALLVDPNTELRFICENQKAQFSLTHTGQTPVQNPRPISYLCTSGVRCLSKDRVRIQKETLPMHSIP